MSVTEHNGVRSNYSKSSGKWYFEVTIDSGTTHYVGVATEDADLDNFAGFDAFAWTYHDLDGKKYNNGSGFLFGDTFVAGDVIGVALDLDNNKVWFAKNGTWQDSGLPASGTDAAFSALPDEEIFAIWSGYDAGEVTANFGDSAFTHDVPAGFTGWSQSPSTITWDEDVLGSATCLSTDALTLLCPVTGWSIYGWNALGSSIATEGKTTGKWYWEVTVVNTEFHYGTGITTQPLSSDVGIGVIHNSLNVDISIGDDTQGFEYNVSGDIRNSGGSQYYGDSFADGDIIGVALDLDNNKIWFSKNGVWQDSGDPAAGTNKAFTLPSGLEFFPSGTVAAYSWQTTGTSFGGSTYTVTSGRSSAELTLNAGDSAFSYTAPTGFLALNALSQTLYGSLSEEVGTDDDYNVESTYGETPADYVGSISENVTLSDYFYAELPGDTEDPTTTHAADTFTMSDSIEGQSPYGDLDEDVELSDEFTLESPYMDLSEGVGLSDDISAIFDPAYLSLAEDVTTDDSIVSPLYGVPEGPGGDNVTTSDSITAYVDSPAKNSEKVTTSDEITVNKDEYLTIEEVLGLNDTPGWGWGKTIADTVDFTETAIAETAWGIEEILTFTEAVTPNWTGTEVVESSLQMLGQLIIGEMFNETATSTIDITDAVAYLHQMISVIADTVDFGETLGTKVDFYPMIAEAIAVTGAVEVLTNLQNTNSETIDLTDLPGMGFGLSLTDTITVTDAATILWYCMNILTESIEFTEAALGLFQFSDTITDAIEFATTLALKQVLTSEITDTIDFGIVIELDGELWECWVLNTNAFHASVYSGFSFNSYAVYNNTAYGCKTDGIYRLSGSTDDGSAFNSGIVLPESRFGTHHKKRFRKAYFGLTGGTTPSIKMVNEDGAGKTYTISKSKVTPTRGVKGRRWTLSVGDFDSLDFVELVPLVLTR